MERKNLINTSIKMPLSIQIIDKNYEISSKFETTLEKIDLINNFSISSYSKDSILYKIIFNGTPKHFLDIMEEHDFSFNTQNKIWILK